MNNPNAIYVPCTIDSLVSLKFTIEHQLSLKYEDIDKSTEYHIYNLSDNSDIYDIFVTYNKNIKLDKQEIMVSQKKLLHRIYNVLLMICDHCWVDDVVDTAFSSYNICYCSNCHIRKRVW